MAEKQQISIKLAKEYFKYNCGYKCILAYFIVENYLALILDSMD